MVDVDKSNHQEGGNECIMYDPFDTRAELEIHTHSYETGQEFHQDIPEGNGCVAVTAAAPKS